MSTQSNIDLIRLIEYNMNGELSDVVDDIFKRHRITSMNVSELVYEIRADGSNSLFYYLREPVDYDEVARDVARVVGVNVKKIGSGDAKDYEEAVLIKCIEKYFDKATEEERKILLHDLDNIIGKQNVNNIVKFGGAGVISLLSVVGQKALMDIIKQIVLKICSIQTAGQIIGRIGGLLIPVLNIIMTVWLAVDIMGPAYRKTIPTVVQSAILRLFNSPE